MRIDKTNRALSNVSWRDVMHAWLLTIVIGLATLAISFLSK